MLSFFMRKINYNYKITYKSTQDFDFKKYENDIVKYDSYLNVEAKAENTAEVMSNDNYTRRAIFYTDIIKNPPCLTSIQFLLDKDTLNVICNFRSQHEKLGKKGDSEMIKYIVTVLLDKLEDKTFSKIKDIIINCNVADYHA